MATEQVIEGLEWAQAAGADLSGKLHYIVKLDTSGNVVLAAAASDSILGVIREEATSGNPATVQFGGIAKVIAGGTITTGAAVTSDGSGKAVAASAGNRILGIALSPNIVSGDIISVALTPGSM